MIESNCHKYYKVPYAVFKKDFDTINWKVSEGFASLESGRYETNKYHASIIVINGIGYWITGFGFIRAELLRIQTLKKLGYTAKGNKILQYPQNKIQNDSTTKSN